jgi:hypothetical protein
MLVAAQQSFAKANTGLSLTFNVEGLQVSQALQNSQTCDQSGLVSDAHATAQTLAAAAGVSVGPILSIAGPGTVGAPSEVISYAGLAVLGGFGFSPFPLGAPAPNNCSLTVQYQMLP